MRVRARKRKVCVHGGPAVGGSSAAPAPSLVLRLRPSTATLGAGGCDEPLRAGPATHVQRGHGRPGVEVPADPAARGSQCPLRRGPLLAIHLSRLPTAQREGDCAGGAATGHGVEEEPDGGQSLQVLLLSRLHPARVLSSRDAEDRVTGEDRLAEALSSRPSCPIPFLCRSQPGDISQGPFPRPYPGRCADTCFGRGKSVRISSQA